MTTNRLDWTIEKKNFWVATNRIEGVVLVAPTKSELMRDINRWESERGKD